VSVIGLRRWRGILGQHATWDLSGNFSGKQMTLDPPEEYAAWIVFLEDLEMRVEAVTIHFHVEASFLTPRTNLYLSALDSCSHWKNRVVRDQSFSLPDI
jgi:hypothetical protein